MSKRSGFLFPDRGMLKGFTSEAGINTIVSVEKQVWNYLPSTAPVIYIDRFRLITIADACPIFGQTTA